MTTDPDASRREPKGRGSEPGTAVAVGRAGDEAAARVEVPAMLPVLPLKNTVLFPHLLSPLLVSSPRSKQLIEEVLVSPQRMLVCVAVRDAVEGSPGAERRATASAR